MATLLYGSINLSKVDKSKLFEGKTGDKYLNVSIWVNDQEDQYGNSASVQQSVSKEEREAGVKPTYIGNLKKGGSGNGQGAPAAPAAPAADNPDLPF